MLQAKVEKKEPIRQRQAVCLHLKILGEGILQSPNKELFWQ
jgi:hypothetical protein